MTAGTNTQTPPQPTLGQVVPKQDIALPPEAAGAKAHWELVQRQAKALSYSTMVPEQYRGDAGFGNCVIAIGMAQRIGADVFAVMQNLDIIHGRPGWRSTFIIGSVNASQRFSPLRFEWFGTAGQNDWGCRAYARSKEDGEVCTGMTITWGIAKKEGWVDKKGSKWQTMPEQMFMYRAAAFWARVFCPEILLGMHSAEEVADMQPDSMPATASLDAARPPVVSDALYAEVEPVKEAPKAEKPPEDEGYSDSKESTVTHPPRGG